MRGAYRLTAFEAETTQNLFKAFMQFKQINWHEKQIAGYNPSEIKVLFAIKHGTNEEKKDMKVSEISKQLHITSPSVTQIINKLEKDDIVLRNIDPSDRRAVNIRLTDKGIQVVSEAKAVLSATFVGLIDFLGEEDSQRLSVLLTKVFTYYDQIYRK